jgi:beta-lactamase regulating signal transducer with metallopeptidase domain
MIPTMIKSAIALLAAASVASSLRRRSASLRHAVWTAGLLAAMAVPLCAWLLPEWQLAARWTGGIPSSLQGVVTYTGGIQQIAIVIWLGGAAVGMLLLLFGTGRLMWIAFGSVPVHDARWEALAEDVRQQLGIQRPVRLLQNRRVPYLGTWGIVAPRVLLPTDADTWTDSRVRMVLAHELSHIKRHDWVVQVLADAARAIYWFNPMFWLASSRLRRESELACDDAVLRLGVPNVQYAEELLSMTRSLRGEHPVQYPIVAMAQPSQLERRLVALLDPTLSRLAATPWAAAAVAAVAIALTLPLAAVRTTTTQDFAQPAPNTFTKTKQAPTATAQPPVQTMNVSGGQLVSSAVSQALPANKKAETPDLFPPQVETLPGPLASAAVEERPQLAEVLPAAPEPQPLLPAFECKVTPSVRGTRQTFTKVSFGDGPWLMNEDKTIWAADQPYIAGRSVTTLWMRPANTELKISGRRLDTSGQELTVQPAQAFPTPYLATVLTFPEAGCWEVTATAGEQKLTFVTRVQE